MAELSPVIKVSMEKLIHDAMRQVAITIYQEYGIKVTNAQFGWLEDEPVVVDLRTSAYYPRSKSDVVTDRCEGAK